MKGVLNTENDLDFELLFARVKLKASGIPATIVSRDTDGGTKPPIYLVEIDNEYKKRGQEVIWCEPEEIEVIKSSTVKNTAVVLPDCSIFISFQNDGSL